MRIVSHFSIVVMLVGILAGNSAAQVRFPQASQKQTISQAVGDAEIEIVYHRPNVKERIVFGTEADKALVPFGNVWRAGANENTTIEFTQDSKINGIPLPKGKYGFHVIPTAEKWSLIFSKVNDAWGSFTYKQEFDAIRVDIKPQATEMHETLTYSVDNVTDSTAEISLYWDKTVARFNVDFGDVNVRLLSKVSNELTTDPISAAAFVVGNNLSKYYADAIRWLDGALVSKNPNDANFQQTKFSVGFYKVQLLDKTGDRAQAEKLAREIVEIGKKLNATAAQKGERSVVSGRQISALEDFIANR
ncbi:MAG: DUF2911 domain-containing protein [Pyrinomonadaceae bacterium]